MVAFDRGRKADYGTLIFRGIGGGENFQGGRVGEPMASTEEFEVGCCGCDASYHSSLERDIDVDVGPLGGGGGVASCLVASA